MLMSENKVEMTEVQIEAQEYLQMGQTLLGAEKPKEAVEMLNKALNCDPMNKITHITMGIAYAGMERYSEAKKSFNNAIKLDKTFADAFFQLGNVAFLEDDFSEGLNNYNQAIYFGYANAELYYNLGLVYEEREEYSEALRNYTKAITVNPNSPVYMVRKASLQIMIGKYEEALQTLEKLRINCPDSFDGYHLTAAVFTMLGEYEKADELLKHAQVMFPDDKDLIMDRIRVLVTKGDDQAALNILQDAKKMDCTAEEIKEIYLNEAKIYAQQENIEKSIEIFEKALELPDALDMNPEIRYYLMNAYMAVADYENLRKITKTVDRKDTVNAFNLCGVYFECVALKALDNEEYTKMYEKAIKYYRNISLDDPSRIDAYLFRAMCYKDLKKYEKAVETIDYVILIQPKNGQLHQIKGNILSEMGQKPEAQAEYEEAKKLGFDASVLGGGTLA